MADMNPLQRHLAERFAAKENLPVAAVVDLSITDWDISTPTYGEGWSLLVELVYDIGFMYRIAGETELRRGWIEVKSVEVESGASEPGWPKFQQALLATVNNLNP